MVRGGSLGPCSMRLFEDEGFGGWRYGFMVVLNTGHVPLEGVQAEHTGVAVGSMGGPGRICTWRI